MKKFFYNGISHVMLGSLICVQRNYSRCTFLCHCAHLFLVTAVFRNLPITLPNPYSISVVQHAIGWKNQAMSGFFKYPLTLWRSSGIINRHAKTNFPIPNLLSLFQGYFLRPDLL